MKLVVYRDTAATDVAPCDGTGLGRTCDVTSGDVFSVGVFTDPAPSGGFTAYEANLTFNSGNVSLIQQPDPNENVWPHCDPALYAEDDTTPGLFTVQCGTGDTVNIPYSGGLVVVQFRCLGSDAIIDLQAGAGGDASLYIRSGIPSTLFLNGPDRVHLDCLPPTPTSTATATATATATPTPTPTPVPHVFIDPASQTTSAASVSVDVRVEDVVDLGSYDLVVTWDSSVLTMAGISNGPFLGSTGRTVTCPGVVLGGNSVSFGCSTVGGQPGPNGSGVLATIDFATVAPGTSPVDLPGVVLRDTADQVLPVTTAAGTVAVVPTSTSGFPASADTYVREDDANKNYGSDDRMDVKSDPSKLRHSLVQFDLTSIPLGSEVQSATLTLCFTKVQAGRVLTIRSLLGDWAETAVTWNSRPAAAATDTASMTVPSTETCVDSSVTGDVQSWVAGVANYGWRIQDQDETTNSSDSRFATREHATAGIRPSLTVTYTACSDTAPPATPTGLVATSDDYGIALDWNDNGESDLAGYHVYRADAPGGPYTRISASLSPTSAALDTTAIGGTTYWYVITAADNCLNESGFSMEAGALAHGSLNLHQDHSMDAGSAGSGTIHMHDGDTEYFEAVTDVSSATNVDDWSVVFVLLDKPLFPAQATIEIWWQTGGQCSDGPVPGQIFASDTVTVPVAVDGLGVRLTVARTSSSVSRTFGASDLLCALVSNLETGNDYDIHALGDSPATSGEPGTSRLAGPFASP